MKKNNILKHLLIILVASFFAILMISCDNDVTPTLYQDLPNEDPPVISSVNPPDSGLAGVTQFTITGSNFSADASKNIVYFNGIIAEQIEVSTTRLVVKAPNFVKDSVNIKISVQGVPLFSEVYQVDLKPAISQVLSFQDFELPYAVTTDNSNTLYFNLVSNGVSTGFSKVTSNGTIESFSPKGGESFYREIRYAANGKVYGTRNPPVRALFGSEEATAPKAIAVSDQQARLLSMDIDNNNNIWVGGSGGNIYRISADESNIQDFPFEPVIQSLRFFNGYLYAAAKTDSIQNIWRMPVNSAQELGEAEDYYNITENLPNLTVNAITFSADGNLLMGTNAIGADPNSLLVLSPGKTLSQWYPTVISGPIMAFTWDKGNFLYYVRERVVDQQQQLILKINMGMLGAPYYGRD